MAASSVEPICLGPADLVPYRSTYLSEGRRHECYILQSVRIQDDRLDAHFDIRNPFISASDSGGFRLSIYPAQEVCGELLTIYVHKRLGLAAKLTEAWMRECRCTIRRPVRSLVNIRVEMVCSQFRIVRGMVYVRALFSLSDEKGGLFLLEQCGGMMNVAREVCH